MERIAGHVKRREIREQLGRRTMRKFRTSIHVTVEASAGSSIEHVCSEIVDLAQRLMIGVDCKFNDVLLMAGPDTDRNGLAEAYRRECESDRPCKIATA